MPTSQPRESNSLSRRERWTSLESIGGGLTPRRELGGKEARALSVNVVCMCLCSDVLSGVSGREV